MSRDARKVSRSLEDRSIAGSTTKVSQISHTDNELKQKLETISHSYKLSNKRIDNETRELRQILYGLQQELRVSKDETKYVPSLIEQPQARKRRTTVSSVPSEDRNLKKGAGKRDVSGITPAQRPSVVGLRRAGSFPPVTHEPEVKKQKDVPEELEVGRVDLPVSANDEEFQEFGVVLKRDAVEFEREIDGQTNKSQVTQRFTDRNDGSITNAQRETEISRREHNNRRVRRNEGEQKLLTKRSSKEQLLPGGRKRSEGGAPFVNSFKGRFITSQETPNETTTSTSPSYPHPPINAGRVSIGGLNVSRRQRPSVTEEVQSIPQRKLSLSIPEYLAQRKGSVSPRGFSPKPGQFSSSSAQLATDSLPEEFGGRRLSVAHGRFRKSSRVSGLPTLREERLTPNQGQEIPTENWSELSKCRYLRKEEQEISIDDIFSKK